MLSPTNDMIVHGTENTEQRGISVAGGSRFRKNDKCCLEWGDSSFRENRNTEPYDKWCMESLIICLWLVLSPTTL